jgi:hypothetical protein
MGKAERRAMRLLGLKPEHKKDEKPVSIHFFKEDSVWRKNWIIGKWYEKLILILSFLGLMYSIFRILLTGWF